MRTISDTNLAFVVNKGLKRVELTFKPITLLERTKNRARENDKVFMAVLVTETLIEIKVKNQYSTFHQINLFRISYSVLAIEALKIFGILFLQGRTFEFYYFFWTLHVDYLSNFSP